MKGIRHGGDVFAVSRERGWDWRDVLDMSASINPLGPSPRVEPAVRAALERIVHYPEPEPVELRAELARAWGVEAETILLGNGATELLHFHAREASNEGVALAVPTFSEFHRAYPGADLFPWDDPGAWPSEGLLVVTQPNSPTGATLSPRARSALLARPGPTLVDESFIEFTGEASLVRAAVERDDFFVLRSLTKFYALPGLRVGALAASRTTLDRLRPHREPWQVNVLAEAAARAALADAQHARETLALVAAERARLGAAFAERPGWTVEPSRANYLLIRVGFPVQALRERLLEEKILIRVCSGAPGIEGEAFRIAIRRPAENDRFLNALRRAAADIKASGGRC